MTALKKVKTNPDGTPKRDKREHIICALNAAEPALASVSFASIVQLLLVDGSLEPEPKHFYKFNSLVGTLVQNLPRSGVKFMSIGTHIDRDDCFCVHSSKLFINMTKNTYQQLGLVGKLSSVQQGRYVFVADLTQPDWQRGTKNYKRLIECLTRFFIEPYTFCMTLDSDGNHDDFLKALDAQVCEPRYAQMSHEMLVPDLEPFSPFEKVEFDPMTDYALRLLEWIGMVSVFPLESENESRLLDAETIDPFIAVYDRLPSSLSTISHLRLDGFFTSESILQTFKDLQYLAFILETK